MLSPEILYSTTYRAFFTNKYFEVEKAIDKNMITLKFIRENFKNFLRKLSKTMNTNFGLLILEKEINKINEVFRKINAYDENKKIRTQIENEWIEWYKIYKFTSTNQAETLLEKNSNRQSGNNPLAKKLMAHREQVESITKISISEKVTHESRNFFAHSGFDGYIIEVKIDFILLADRSKKTKISD